MRSEDTLVLIGIRVTHSKEPSLTRHIIRRCKLEANAYCHDADTSLQGKQR
jgi:hypothetical protein